MGKVRVTRIGTGGMRVPLSGPSSSLQTPRDNVCGLTLPGWMSCLFQHNHILGLHAALQSQEQMLWLLCTAGNGS